MLQIPLIAHPNRRFQVLLAEQECTMAVYQRGGNVYLDLMVGASPIITGAICQQGASIVQKAQAIFQGSLHFFDTQGNSAPQWYGLGTRWVLVYVGAKESVPEALQF